MKSDFPHIGLARLCGWFGITRQAYYQYNWNSYTTSVSDALVLGQVHQIRRNHRRMGTRKLYEMLEPFMLEHSIKMGRDALFDLLSANQLLVRKRRRNFNTTNSHHWLRKYPNLIRGFIPTAINQLWVSDITYWKLNETHVYISFVTDAYSHKIVGYQLAETLEAAESITALQMALNGLKGPVAGNLIHHSDRGFQYCSQGYVKLLQDHQISISMTENGDPLENAIAERINGIIKEEYLEFIGHDRTMPAARAMLQKVVDLYNTERPHMSIGNLTPDQVYQTETTIKTERLWKNYYRKQTMFVNSKQD